LYIGRGATAPKKKTIYVSPQRQAHAAVGTSHFVVDGTGFVKFRESFKYLDSIIYYSHTLYVDVCKRKKLATAVFGTMTKLFGDKYLP